MTRRPHLTLLLGFGLTVLSAACRRDAVDASSPPSPMTTTTTAPAGGPAQAEAPAADVSADICLSDPPAGAAPLHAKLRRSQDEARALPGKPDGWVAAGRVWVQLAMAATNPRLYFQVDACVAAALARDPGNAAALGLRGLVFMNAHRFDEARAVAEQILARDPANLVALGTLSDALLELGRYDDAVVPAQHMIDVHPDLASYTRGAHLRWLNGDVPAAKLLMRNALAGRGDPGATAWAFVQAALIFMHDGDLEGADAVFAAALKWVPDYAPALVGRGRVAMSLGRPQEAATHFAQALALQPLCETAWLLGDARAALGDAAGAQAAYDQVIEEGRLHDHLTLARFFAEKDRDLPEALALIEGERRHRGGVYLDDAYALVLYRLGRHEEARAMIDRATRLGTPDPLFTGHAALIHGSGRTAEAPQLSRR